MGGFVGIYDSSPFRTGEFDIDCMKSFLAPYGCRQRITAFENHFLACQNVSSEAASSLVPKVSSTNFRIILDGSIYNLHGLAASLGRSACVASQSEICDLLIRGYEKWGSEVFERLNGDWTIALIDIMRGVVLLARDPFGTRPLFYSVIDTRVVFGSLARQVALMTRGELEVNESFAFSMLAMVPLSNTSQYVGAMSVTPGCWVEIGAGKIVEKEYYSIDAIEPLTGLTDRQYEDRFCETVRESVSRRVSGESSVSAYLSSGLDSSTVAAIAASCLEPRGGTVHAFTAAPRSAFAWQVRSGWHGDESRGASAVAAGYPNVRHRIIPAIQGSLLESMRRDIDLMDRPAINPCNMGWVNAIRECARNTGTDVLLTGSMGNATISFQGYHELFRLVGEFRFLQWWREVNEFIRNHPKARLRAMAEFSFAPFLPKWVWEWSQKRRGRFLALPDFSAINLDFAEEFSSGPGSQSRGWDLSDRPIADSRVWRSKLLRGFDRGPYTLAADAWGVELRDPTIDRDLVDFCISLPDSQYLKDGRPRSILQRALKNVLPKEVLECETRGYQAPDWPLYLLSERENLLGALEEARGAGGSVEKFVDIASLMKDLQNLPCDGFHKAKVELRYRQRLLRGLSFALWASRVARNNR